LRGGDDSTSVRWYSPLRDGGSLLRNARDGVNLLLSGVD